MIKQIKERQFITSLKNLFDPTRGSNTSRTTNSLPLFYLFNHTLNFQNWRLISVLQCIYTVEKNIKNLAIRTPAAIPCFHVWARLAPEELSIKV